jgi:hypothetical protein
MSANRGIMLLRDIADQLPLLQSHEQTTQFQ